MSAIEVKNKQIPGGPVSLAQPQMLVATVLRTQPVCAASGWDGAGDIATDWFSTGGKQGTVFVEDNGEAFTLDVEVLINPVLTPEGEIDFDNSPKYVLGEISTLIGVGGHLNIDVTQSHFRLVGTGATDPTAAFNAFFWSVR